MLKRNLLVIAILFGVAAPVSSESWTNQAGRVIEGKLSQFDGTSLTIIRTNGVKLRLPLSALCKPDQHRVLALNAFSIAPDFVVAAYRDASVVLERYHRLPPEQQTSPARAAAVQMACAVFDGRLRARQSELTDQAVHKEVMRLRGLLVQGGM